jgi:hypothetical protein
MTMRALLVGLLILFSQTASAADPDADYLALVDAAAANPAEAKWCDIRARYPDTSFYHTHLGLQIKKATMEAGQKMIDEKSKDSVAAFKDFMRKNAAAVGAHFYAAYIYKWNNDLVKQKMDGLLPDFGHGVDYIDPRFEKNAADELLKCILKTGDGRSQKTAYQLVTVDEGEVLIDKYYNVNPVGIENVKADGHVFDIVTIEIPESRVKEDLYFELDDRLVRGAIAAELAEKLKPSLPKKAP